VTFLYNQFQGKSTFFAFVFMCAGIGLAFTGKLTPTYVSLAGAVQILLVTRAIADDFHTRAMKGLENGNGTSPVQH
jgi:hypothetical protein